LRLYRRLAEVKTLEEVDELGREWADRFGAWPAAVQNLLYMLRLKVLAMQAGVESIATEDHRVALALREPERLKGLHLGEALARSVMLATKHIYVRRGRDEEKWKRVLYEVMERLADRGDTGSRQGRGNLA